MANNDMDRVVPLGQLDDFRVAEGDPDVRGWEVLASDGRKIGEVDELLVDTTAMKVRYLDVDVEDGVIGDGMDRHVLIPIGYARLERERDTVRVDDLASGDLRSLPAYDQGPLTRDFENNVRDSFPRRGTGAAAATAAGAGGAGMLDTAGLDNTPGTGTGMGMTGTTTGAGVADAGTGMRADASSVSGTGPAKEGVRASGVGPDRDRPITPSLGGEPRDTDSSRTIRDSGAKPASSGFSASDAQRSNVTGTARKEPGITHRSDEGIAGSKGSTSSGLSAGSREPGKEGVAQGDLSHRAGKGSDYLHNGDEDFYANEAFDDNRFYGARREGRDIGGASGSRMSERGMESSERSGGMSASPGTSGGTTANRDDVSRSDRDVGEPRKDVRDRGMGDPDRI
ncbi:MAG TPA: PRC-barrel domain-containing protein [Longimicrobium sp.]|nr:PRC-barrel domain-containing protein [Longimicrobium sp.]